MYRIVTIVLLLFFISGSIYSFNAAIQNITPHHNIIFITLSVGVISLHALKKRSIPHRFTYKNKAFYLILSFCLAINTSLAQTEITEAPAGESFEELSVEASLLWLNNNYVESSDDFHEKALLTLDRVYQLKDEQLKAETHLLLMRWHAFHVPFNNDSIFPHGEKAIALFEKTNDEVKLAASSVTLASQYIEKNELERAEKLIFDAINIYETLEDEKA